MYNEYMDYVCVRTPEALSPYREALCRARVLGVDLETTGLNPHADRVRLVQIAMPDAPVLVIDCDTFLPEGIPLLREALSGDAVKVFQNAKFDLSFLRGIGIVPHPIFDTMLAAQLLFWPGRPRRANLETLAAYYLGETLDKKEQTSDFGGALTEAQCRYAAKDAEILLRLRRLMEKEMDALGLSRIAQIEFAAVHAVAQMERAGMWLDLPKWEALHAQTEEAMQKARDALYRFTGENAAQLDLWGHETPLGRSLDSGTYVLGLLHENGIPVQATAKSDLYPYRDHPLVAQLTVYRRAAKLLSAFLRGMPQLICAQTGRLHPSYAQIGAHSGRMSCWHPNIQQIPRDKAFRECFAAPPGRRLVIADYSQIELRVAAEISGDARMIEAYRRGEDLHLLTASLLSGKPGASVSRAERQAAKAVNFGLIYGMGAAGLSQYAEQSFGTHLPIESAARFRERFFAAYPGIGAWHRRILSHPGREGRTLTGRRFPLSQTPSLPELSNAPVQGTAADIVKQALGDLAAALPARDTAIVAVVHDEILVECPESCAEAVQALLKETMESAARRILPRVPCVAEAKIVRNWAEA